MGEFSVESSHSIHPILQDSLFFCVILQVSLALVDPETNEAEILCEPRGFQILTVGGFLSHGGTP